jgi:hypothetical protein
MASQRETREISSPPEETTRRAKYEGERRFCIDCGVAKGFYIPKDVIEVRSTSLQKEDKDGRKPEAGKLTMWVCSCRYVLLGFIELFSFEMI